MARGATKAPRALVVHLPLQQPAPPQVDLSRGSARVPGGGWAVAEIAEIQAAGQRFAGVAESPRIASVLADLSGGCGEIVYEADCLSAVRGAAGAAGDLTAAEQQGVRTRIMEIMTAHPSRAARIREVAAEAGLRIDGR